MKKIICFLIALTTFCFLSCSTGSSYSSMESSDSFTMTSDSSTAFIDEEEDITIAFLTVQEAFEKGDISRNHMIEMARLLNERRPLSVESLQKSVIQGIKKTYSHLNNNVKSEEVVLQYYGIYDECYAVIVFDVNADFDTAITDVEVAGVVFSYPVSGLEITICKIN